MIRMNLKIPSGEEKTAGTDTESNLSFCIHRTSILLFHEMKVYLMFHYLNSFPLKVNKPDFV